MLHLFWPLMYSGQSQGSTRFPSFFLPSYIIITVPWENQASAYHISILQSDEGPPWEKSEQEGEPGHFPAGAWTLPHLKCVCRKGVTWALVARSQRLARKAWLTSAVFPPRYRLCDIVTPPQIVLKVVFMEYSSSGVIVIGINNSVCII